MGQKVESCQQIVRTARKTSLGILKYLFFGDAMDISEFDGERHVEILEISGRQIQEVVLAGVIVADERTIGVGANGSTSLVEGKTIGAGVTDPVVSHIKNFPDSKGFSIS